NNASRGDGKKERLRPLLSSQAVLFKSRKKNALVYMLATIVGIFCAPGGITFLANSDPAILLERTLPLPFITLLMAVGLYVLNDLTDVEIDRANNKKRPIPMRIVSRRQTIFFIILTNCLAAGLAFATGNLSTVMLVAPMAVLGILYSAPRI